MDNKLLKTQFMIELQLCRKRGSVGEAFLMAGTSTTGVCSFLTSWNEDHFALKAKD